MKENTEASSAQFEQINRDLIKSMKSRKHLELLGFYCYLKTHEVWKDDFEWTIPNGPSIVLNKGELRLTENKIRKDLNLHLYGLQEMLAEMEQIGFIQLSRIVASQSGKKEYKIYKMFDTNKIMFDTNIFSMTQNVRDEQNNVRYEQNNVRYEQNNVRDEQNNVRDITTNYTTSNSIILDQTTDQTTEELSSQPSSIDDSDSTKANDLIDDFLEDTSFTLHQLKTRVELLMNIDYLKKTSIENKLIEEYYDKAKSINFIDKNNKKITIDRLAKMIAKVLNKAKSNDTIAAPFTLEQIYDKLKSFKISMTEDSKEYIKSKYDFYCRRNFKQKNGSVWNLVSYVQWMIKLMKEDKISFIDEEQENKPKVNVLKL